MKQNESSISMAQLYEIYKAHSSIQTDTRQLKKGDVYFALKGPNFNGNEFAISALEKGATYAIVDEPIQAPNNFKDQIIVVDDVLTSLQALAKFHREQFTIPFIAITGSNGKTTTKELVAAVLSSHYTTYTTKGNLNNHIGVPLTLLSIQKDAQMAIVEMGANHLNEIKSYCNYTLPTHGLINNCGKAHLEGFGSEEGVKKGKGELFDFLKMHQGVAFVNSDLAYLEKMSAGISTIISYGTISGALQARATENMSSLHTGYLTIEITKCKNPTLVNKQIKTKLVGGYNLPNVLAAICIGLYFNVPEQKIITAIENYTPNNSRSQLIDWQNNKVILDAYNANPSSMQLAIENFNKIQASHKVLMLGSMAELGVDSLNEHQQIVNLIANCSFQAVVLVGDQFAQVQHPYLQFATAKEAADWYQKQNFQHTHFLIKGSRSMKMETILH